MISNTVILSKAASVIVATIISSSAYATCTFDSIEYDCANVGGDHIHISGSYLSKPSAITVGQQAWIVDNILYSCNGGDCSVTKIFQNGNMAAVNTTNPSCLATAFKDGYPYVFGMTFPCAGTYHVSVSISTTSGSFFYSYDQNQIATYKETFTLDVLP